MDNTSVETEANERHFSPDEIFIFEDQPEISTKIKVDMKTVGTRSHTQQQQNPAILGGAGGAQMELDVSLEGKFNETYEVQLPQHLSTDSLLE